MNCPVCKADLTAGPTCRRCRADVSPLFRLEEERTRLAAAAARALRDGQGQRGLALAAAVAALRPGADASRLRALGLLCSGDFAAAFLEHRRGRT